MLKKFSKYGSSLKKYYIKSFYLNITVNHKTYNWKISKNMHSKIKEM